GVPVDPDGGLLQVRVGLQGLAGDTDDVELAVAEGEGLGGQLPGELDGDPLDLHVVGIPVLGVLLHLQVRVGAPIGEHLWAVAHPVLGQRPVLRLRVDGVRVEHAHRVVGHVQQQVRIRVVQLDDDGRFVRGADADVVRGVQCAGLVVGGTFDLRAREVARGPGGVPGAGSGWAQQPLEGPDGILCGDRVAVGPVRLAQVEGIGQLVLGDVPGLGEGGVDVAAGLVLHQQALHHAGGQDVHAAVDVVRVEAVDVRGAGDGDGRPLLAGAALCSTAGRGVEDRATGGEQARPADAGAQQGAPVEVAGIADHCH